MTAFQQAHSRAVTAIKLRGYLYTLECRWNTRFRLWEQPHDADGRARDPALADRTACLAKRQYAARLASERADCRLGELWDHLSRQLPPAGSLTDADAYLSDTRREGAADLFADLIARGIADNPDWYDRERHDARLIVDDLLLRRVRL
jgi:hypothetical protein